MPNRIRVLRLGHRKGRDPRITTHLALVARALGADEFLLAGDLDESVFSNIDSVNKRFGGNMSYTHVKSPTSWLEKFTANGGQAVHLTMYGIPYRKAVEEVDSESEICIVVGGSKVPGEVFKICQHNVSVGNQPHSEVAALALFMDAWKPAPEVFENAELVILPSAQGKEVIERAKE